MNSISEKHQFLDRSQISNQSEDKNEILTTGLA
jgi:hypothetical protein